MKKNILFSLAMLLCFLPGIVQGYDVDEQKGAQEWTLFLDGMNLEPDVPPEMTDEGTMILPIRFIIEGLGGDIHWTPNTKEVSVTVSGQQLYIHFTDGGRADTITLNGEAVEFQKYSHFTIISGRTMVAADFVERIIERNINSLVDMHFIHIHNGDESDTLLEEFLTMIHKADRHLENVFLKQRKSTKQRLEASLQKYYSHEIAQMIIEYYYHENVDGTYSALPTEKPIALLPLRHVQQIRLDSVIREETPRQILSVHRKPTLFNAYEVHSLYQFHKINKQWFIVEIVHHLVDNSSKGIVDDGGTTV